MLLPHEFSVDYIGNVTQLTLVLPVDDYDRAFLVTLAPGKLTAIAIDEREGFASFICESNRNWKGVLVPNIAIELDEGTTFDAVGLSPPLGMLVRQQDRLFISTRPDGGLPRNKLVPILTGLPPNQANMAVGFKKWQIVIGDGLSKRTLMALDTERPKKSSV